MIDGWDPPTVLDAMVEEEIARRQRLHLLLHQPARLPRVRARARGADALHRAGRLAHPQRGGRAGGRARDLAGALLRLHGAPVGDGLRSTRRPRRSASTPTAGPLEWVEIRTVDEDGHDVGVGQPGEILTPGPRPLRRLHRPRAVGGGDRRGRLVPHRRRRRDRRRRLPDHHRPGEGHHHPRRRERERRRGRAAAGPHEGRGRGGRGGGARRAVRRARLRLLPHAARERARPTSRPCGRTWPRRAWPARSGPRSCASSTSCRARLRARSRSSCCGTGCAPAADRACASCARAIARVARAEDGTLRPTLIGRESERREAVVMRSRIPKEQIELLKHGAPVLGLLAATSSAPSPSSARRSGSTRAPT